MLDLSAILLKPLMIAIIIIPKFVAIVNFTHQAYN